MTRDNVQASLRNPAVRRALVADEDASRSLGVDRDWTVRAVTAHALVVTPAR